MTDVAGETPNTKGIERRTILRGAAWSVPVIAAAVAAPAFAASVAGKVTNLYWSKTSIALADLRLLNGNLLNLTVLPTGPTQIAGTKTAAAIPNVTVEVTVKLVSDLAVSVSVGKRYVAGFAPWTLGGIAPSAPTVITPRQIGGINLGRIYAQDTTTTFALGTLPASQTAILWDVKWAVAKAYVEGLSLVNIDLNANFAITVVVKSGGTTVYTLDRHTVGTGLITVPVGAGLL